MYPSSKKNVDWDKIDKEIEEDIKKNKVYLLFTILLK